VDEWVMSMSKKENTKRSSKKVKIIILAIIVVLLIGGGVGGYFFYQSKKLLYTLHKNVVVNIGDEVKNTSALKIIKNGTLQTKEENVDTSKVGKQTITLSIKDSFNKIKKVSYVVEVVDKEAPKITFNASLKVEEGNDINLLDGVSATDNSKEEITVTVEGEYDTKTPGNYELFYVAKDSSGNETKEKFQLEVTKKVVVQSSSSGYVAPDSDFTTSNGHKGTVRNGVTYIDGVLIANKTYALPSSYNPGGLTQEFTSNFDTMKAAASNEGIYFEVFSGFRSYINQVYTYQGWVNQDGKAAADTYSARPGHSEHQSGLAADINSINNINNYEKRFEESDATEWLANNAYKYGFILRYPQGKQSITGYVYESWHFRYVGTSLATKLYNGGNWITMEEYFGITSQYNY